MPGFFPGEKSRVVEKGAHIAHAFKKNLFHSWGLIFINSWSSIIITVLDTHDHVVFIAENDKALDKWSSIRNRRIIVVCFCVLYDLQYLPVWLLHLIDLSRRGFTGFIDISTL